MNVVNHLDNYLTKEKSILTIGTFDGLHVGHKLIIKTLVEEAAINNLLANVLTFFPHPRMVLNKEANIKLIDTIKEKEKHLKKLGINTLIVHPFSKEFSRMTSVEFTRDILIKKLNISKLVIGYDHRFGRDRDSDVNDLVELGNTYGFNVKTINEEQIKSVTVSSTKIRKSILEGDIKNANLYLGRFFELSGQIIKGQGLGRKIGFPTANIKINEDYKLIPGNGVYLVQVKVNNETYFGMINIGFRPTVNGNNITLEVFIFNFNDDIYGTIISLFFLNKIRNEIKFNSLEDLKNQIKKDKLYSNLLIKQNKYKF
jgi:riboflavin kinase/FMN adenylyltransferase